MNTAIYYFTGTGNSLKVSKDLSQYLENVELFQVRKERLSQQLYTNAEAIGFVFPTIFSGIPKLLGEFIKHLNITKPSPYIFAVCTHGDRNGMGIVFEQIEKLLEEKGLSLSACFSIQMPHNMPEKDHVTSAEEKEQLFAEEAARISLIAESIGKSQLIPHKNKKLRSIFGHMTYNMVHKFASKISLDKGFNVDEKCINCSACSKICPAKNIEMVDEKPKWKLKNCQFCFACVQWCPKAAIQFKKGTIGIERYHHPEIKVNELFYSK